MANGYIDPFALYAYLPYPYPLIETFPLVRIPVSGPKPFNTLVCVRSRTPLTHFGYADGKLRRYRIAIGTGFQLIGFDPRVPPAFEHSSTGAIQLMEADDDTAFVVALDNVAGAFDDHGNWILTVDYADLWDGVFATSFAYLSSWVLCWEPPPQHAPEGSLWKKSLITRPPSSWMLEAMTVEGHAGLLPETRGVPKPDRRRRLKPEKCGEQGQMEAHRPTPASVGDLSLLMSAPGVRPPKD